MNKIKIFIGTAGILPFAGASILLWALQLHACFGLSFDKCDGVLSILKYFLITLFFISVFFRSNKSYSYILLLWRIVITALVFSYGLIQLIILSHQYKYLLILSLLSQCSIAVMIFAWGVKHYKFIIKNCSKIILAGKYNEKSKLFYLDKPYLGKIISTGSAKPIAPLIAILSPLIIFLVPLIDKHFNYIFDVLWVGWLLFINTGVLLLMVLSLIDASFVLYLGNRKVYDSL